MTENLSKIFELDPAGLAYDSRRVEPGFVFFAIQGFQLDGHDYVGDAVQRGAAAVVVEKDIEEPAGVAVFRVPDSRAALASAAARFYGYPAQRLRMVGVTGTNGKTTTTHLISAIYGAQGEKVGLIGTLCARIGDVVVPEERTTPESLELQALLRRMADAGVTVAVMEVSSHALALQRVAGVEYDVAVFTNLTQDHLDFHKDLEDYFRTKELLFTGLKAPAGKQGSKLAVVNADDRYGVRLASTSGGRVLTYGVENPAGVRARDIVLKESGADFTVEGTWGKTPLRLKLAGGFNVYNALAAFATGFAEGFPPGDVARALENAGSVPGRFERVDAGQDFTVVVDYAHTPDGLENVLRAARALARGKVVVVFGCGGDRDSTKRPLMGEAAGRLADFAVVTSDNPRSEDPRKIIAAVETGVRSAGQTRYIIEPDRRKAIKEAFTRAQPGDIVVLAGKGHEDYQIIGTQKIPFDDRKVAVEVWQEIRIGKGRGSVVSS
ncbi:MAG: UDP-N-acetylmuramoyl-L-alanyl-D-glutamate--2,6-diaminopimelate ligase [Bacillota bacterium]